MINSNSESLVVLDNCRNEALTLSRKLTYPDVLKGRNRMVWNPLRSFKSPKSEISIELEDEHHVYRPGESVSGRVIAQLGRNYSGATIAVSFKGRLKIRGRKPQLKAQESIIFNDRVVLSEKNALDAGKHAFPFELELPQEGLLESIDFDMGNISYVIRCTMGAEKEEIHHASRAIKVAAIRDVTLYSAPKAVTLNVDTSKKRKKENKITVKLSIPHKGWTPGEHIPIKLSIQHQWDVQSPASIAVTLSRISQFAVGESEYTYRKDLDQSILGLYTHPSTQVAELTTNLSIPPDSLITASTDIIKFSYLIEAAIDLTGKLDLGNWANSNPAVKMIDTDRVRNRPGVVSSWAEIIIGTHRSEDIVCRVSRTDTTSEIAQTANVDPPSSLESSDIHSQRNQPSQHSSNNSVVVQNFSDSAAATEKMVLATRAQTLIPSVPEYPQPQDLPSAPSLPVGSVNHSIGSDDKDMLRLRQLASQPVPESAPAYSPRGESISSEISTPIMPVAESLAASAPPPEPSIDMSILPSCRKRDPE